MQHERADLPDAEGVLSELAATFDFMRAAFHPSRHAPR
jgi:hypothetical protein